MTEQEKALREAAVKEVEREKKELRRKLSETASQLWDDIKDRVLKDAREEMEKPRELDPYQKIVESYDKRRR